MALWASCFLWGSGVKSIMCMSTISSAFCKKRLNGAVSRNNPIKRMAPCQCLDGHVKEPYKISMALGARPKVQLLLQSACTSMCRHIYDWNIVDCDVKQPLHLTSPLNCFWFPSVLLSRLFFVCSYVVMSVLAMFVMPPSKTEVYIALHMSVSMSICTSVFPILVEPITGDC